MAVHTSNAIKAVMSRHMSRVTLFCASLLNGVRLAAYDRLLGVSTAGYLLTEDCVLSTGGDNAHYEGCQWLPVRRALKKLAPNRSDVFVDLGAGRGKALLIAGRLPYKRVVGVEIDESLSQCARANIENVQSRLRAQEVTCKTSNVLDWAIPDDVSIIFMFNPFIDQTFHTVLDRVFESYDRQPRTVHIVYAYPWEHDWLLSTGRVVVKSVRPSQWPAKRNWWRGGHVIVTYRVVASVESDKYELGLFHRWFRPNQAIRRWRSPNGHRFDMWAPGYEHYFKDSSKAAQ